MHLDNVMHMHLFLSDLIQHVLFGCTTLCDGHEWGLPPMYYVHMHLCTCMLYKDDGVYSIYTRSVMTSVWAHSISYINVV